MMDRVDEQTAMIVALETYWKHHPELRLGQIIATQTFEWNKQFDPFYLPDSTLFEILGKLIYSE